MAYSEHSQHKYSVTIHTDDLAVVGCLRALAKYSQQTGNNNIPWGGTKDVDWIRNSHNVAFHFSQPKYREGFVAELNRLLPAILWKVISTGDNDPATPQRR